MTTWCIRPITEPILLAPTKQYYDRLGFAERTSNGGPMSGTSSDVIEPRVLLGGLAMPESPRWHNGRLWFSNWGAGEIVAVDLDGNSEVVGRGPEGTGWAVNWLPDNRMLITGSELVRVEPDGSRLRHADLSHLSPYGWSEITVDGRGNIYVNTINFDFADFDAVLASGQAPGKIALVTPDGDVCEVASEIAFPNGMVITSDNKTLIVAESFAARLTAFDVAEDGTLSNRRVWADGVGPDGICLDTDGCIWASSGAMINDCARIREHGDVLETIELDRPCFAAMLGGPDRRTLFMLTAEWRGTEAVEDVVKARTGQVLVADAPAPGVGWP
jgi:sugar lactone lactonase YvrE